MFKHDTRMPRGLQRLRKYYVVERVVGIVGKIRIGVALDHSQPLSNAFIHALSRQFDASAIDIARFAQETKQFAIAAADIQDFRAAFNHFGDENQVDARATRYTHSAGVVMCNVGA
jgi:hypothetical protein